MSRASINKYSTLRKLSCTEILILQAIDKKVPQEQIDPLLDCWITEIGMGIPKTEGEYNRWAHWFANRVKDISLLTAPQLVWKCQKGAELGIKKIQDTISLHGYCSITHLLKAYGMTANLDDIWAQGDWWIKVHNTYGWDDSDIPSMQVKERGDLAGYMLCLPKPHSISRKEKQNES
jgi:hypothetical protein